MEAFFAVLLPLAVTLVVVFFAGFYLGKHYNSKIGSPVIILEKNQE